MFSNTLWVTAFQKWVNPLKVLFTTTIRPLATFTWIRNPISTNSKTLVMQNTAEIVSFLSVKFSVIAAKTAQIF